MSSKDLSAGLSNFKVPGSNFGYKATSIGPTTLKSFENTIVLGLVDVSGSTRPFKTQEEACLQEIIKGLRLAPDKLLYSLCLFDQEYREAHGFKLVVDCNETDYDGVWSGGGQTDLYGSVKRSLLTIVDYAKEQAAKRYSCNATLFVISDGLHYLVPSGPDTEDDVKTAMDLAMLSEDLESLTAILIGINPDKSVQEGLRRFSTKVGFTQYEPVENINAKEFARIANFISKSVQSQKVAKGSGGPSQSLRF